MIVKAFNQEFNINTKVETSQFNQKVLLLLQSKRVDLLKELNDFVKAARAEYDKVDSAAWAEYDKVRSAAQAEYDKVRSAAWAECSQKITKKVEELLKKI